MPPPPPSFNDWRQPGIGSSKLPPRRRAAPHRRSPLRARTKPHRRRPVNGPSTGTARRRREARGPVHAYARARTVVNFYQPPPARHPHRRSPTRRRHAPALAGPERTRALDDSVPSGTSLASTVVAPRSPVPSRPFSSRTPPSPYARDALFTSRDNDEIITTTKTTIPSADGRDYCCRRVGVRENGTVPPPPPSSRARVRVTIFTRPRRLYPGDAITIL